jgi:hypothetical protein
MSKRTDIIVSACAVHYALLAFASCAIAFTAGPAWACVTFVAACYLVLLAMFVVMYVGRDDG